MTHVLLQRLLPLLALALLPPVVSAAATGKASSIKAGSVFRDCSYCPEMVVIPAGNFNMGSPSAEQGRSEDEGPQHPVIVAGPYAIGKTEVTQVQWVALMGSNPSYFPNCGADCPVEGVSWNDVQEYLSRLNAKTGKRYRLPSEAEWEYACRAGGAHTYCDDEDIESLAWYRANSTKRPHPVAGKKANAWGLHDMSGNVFEWAADCWNANYEGAPSDGGAWKTGDCSLRVLRGGAWVVEPLFARSTKRLRLNSDARNAIAGFRVVRTLP